jgi:protein ImuB
MIMKNVSTRRRVLALWLYRLSTDRIARARPADAKALVIVGAVRNTLCLTAFDDAAARLGLKIGMTLADARALYPGLHVTQQDAKTDTKLLNRTAAWCERYTPLIGLDNPSGVFLDITGCAHLFGGEAALRDDLLARLKKMGLHVRAAIADTPGCAWALAHHGCTPIAQESRAALIDLPLAALRLEAETILLLQKSGLTHVRDIIGLPRAPLAARFGVALLRRLDQALGHEDEPITPRRTPAPFSVQQNFFEPLIRMDDLLSVIETLATHLCPLMEARGQGARRLEAVLFRVDGEVQNITVGTSQALRDPARIKRLFADRLDVLQQDYDAGFGYDLIRLNAPTTEIFAQTQGALSGPEQGAAIAHLIDRLTARFGAARVQRLLPQDTHIPEMACVAAPARILRDFGTPIIFSQESLGALRPLRLFAQPEPIDAVAEVPDGAPARFSWRRVQHQVTKSEGPERIAMEWWRDENGKALTRDYFRVESASGMRAWLYREGLYHEVARPRWFLHGLFA